MSTDKLARVIDEAFEGRDKIGPKTKGAVRKAVNSALDLLDTGQARVAERLEAAAPIPQDEDTDSNRRPLKVGDTVELGGIRGELVVMEPGKAVVSRGGLRIEVSPERLRHAKSASPERAALP